MVKYDVPVSRSIDVDDSPRLVFRVTQLISALDVPSGF